MRHCSSLELKAPCLETTTAASKSNESTESEVSNVLQAVARVRTVC